jgi:hypothetical protein
MRGKGALGASVFFDQSGLVRSERSQTCHRGATILVPALSRRRFTPPQLPPARLMDVHQGSVRPSKDSLPLVADGCCDGVQVGWQRQFWRSNRGGSGLKTRTATNGEARQALLLLECAGPNQNIARAVCRCPDQQSFLCCCTSAIEKFRERQFSR